MRLKIDKQYSEIFMKSSKNFGIEQYLRKINQKNARKMFLLPFLLGPMALAVVTDASTSDPGVVISENQKLMSLVAPSIDLDLSGLGLRSIDANAFVNCASTRTLNLSNNSIQELPEYVFSSLINLEHLSLANNDLRGLATKNAFVGLIQLKSLNITHNPLKKILDQQNFAGLTSSCDIFIGGSKKFHVISPLAFGKKKVNANVAHIDNQIRSNQENKCTNRSNTYIQTSLIRVEMEIDSNVHVKVCIEENKVKFVDLFNVNTTVPIICKTVELQLYAPELKIVSVRIKSFEKGWYRIQYLPFNAIYLDNNKIGEVTSDLLNDLPRQIRYVSLRGNQLERLNKGTIVNYHLRGLDLSNNDIHVIEEDAFIGTNLTHLYLESNSLTDLSFSLTLPTTLILLNLQSNDIADIPAGSFSHLKKLLDLQLCYNNITELHPQSLSGLDSLQLFELCFVDLKNLQPGVFQHLTNLHQLDLYGNDISTLEKGVFNGLGCLTELDLNYNDLTSFSKDTLFGLTDNLNSLFLNFNELESLEADSFANIPKSDLWIKYNKIRQIEKDAFDLPYLKYLDLRGNYIKRIAKRAAKNLGNLGNETQIKLMSNPIKRLENGALAGLSSRAYVDLSETPIEIIQAGVFEDV